MRFDFSDAPVADRTFQAGQIDQDAILAQVDQAVAMYGKQRRDSVDLWRRPLLVQAAVEQARLGRIRPLVNGDVTRFDADFSKAVSDGRVDSLDAVDSGARVDAPFAAGGATFALRQLEYIFSKVLEEKHKLPSALAHFPITSEVPIGARTYTTRMTTAQGEAVFVRGSNYPMVNGGQSTVKELSRPVRYIGTNVRMNIFETLSAGFANVDLFARNMRAARRAEEELKNRAAWYGSPADDLWGILNYPSLPKMVIGTAFDGTASGDAVNKAMITMQAYPQVVSGMVFETDSVIMSPRVDNFLANTRISSITDTTIKKFFLDNHPGFRWLVAWELQGVGPGGTDGMFWYRNDPEAISIVNVQGLTPLPVQYVGYDQITPMYSAFGGVKMDFVGNNLLGWVTPPANF